jgi:two-component system chemotaxis response regulator CheB
VRDVEALRGRIDAIVIGASAGGVDALSVLLPALPPGLRASLFVVLHLPRERPSLLVDIFAPKCTLQVKEAEDKMRVEAGTVYFTPPDYHLLIDKGPQLPLSIDEFVHFSRPSIDLPFESAANIYAERLMGIILTGANEDGTAGLAAIHRRGGVTIVQEPLMVLSALERTPVDFVLSLKDIAVLLQTLTIAQVAATSTFSNR